MMNTQERRKNLSTPSLYFTKEKVVFCLLVICLTSALLSAKSAISENGSPGSIPSKEQSGKLQEKDKSDNISGKIFIVGDVLVHNEQDFLNADIIKIDKAFRLPHKKIPVKPQKKRTDPTEKRKIERKFPPTAKVSPLSETKTVFTVLFYYKNTFCFSGKVEYSFEGFIPYFILRDHSSFRKSLPKNTYAEPLISNPAFSGQYFIRPPSFLYYYFFKVQGLSFGKEKVCFAILS